MSLILAIIVVSMIGFNFYLWNQIQGQTDHTAQLERDKAWLQDQLIAIRLDDERLLKRLMETARRETDKLARRMP